MTIANASKETNCSKKYGSLAEEEVIACQSAAQMVCESKPSNISKAYEVYECIVENCGIDCDKEGVEDIFDEFANGYGLA